MPEKFFNKFPTISYSNTTCRDLTKRVRIDAEVKTNIDMYYPIEIQSGFRADSLAEAYYDDEEMDWMIYLMNDIVDPYYQWYISELNFEDFIITKYESVANAQERILYYRNNWYEDETEITPEMYENIIDTTWRKYYEPLFTPTNAIYSYKRKKEDWVVNTNRILQYTIALTDPTIEFVEDEIVDIKVSGEIVGGGTVVVTNSSMVTIHHVSGNTSANTTHTKTIIGETSGANGTANAVLTLAENFTTSESKFWSNVSYYDMELEKWESRKNVDVIDSGLVLNIADQVREKLQDT